MIRHLRLAGTAYVAATAYASYPLFGLIAITEAIQASGPFVGSILSGPISPETLYGVLLIISLPGFAFLLFVEYRRVYEEWRSRLSKERKALAKTE